MDENEIVEHAWYASDDASEPLLWIDEIRRGMRDASGYRLTHDVVYHHGRDRNGHWGEGACTLGKFAKWAFEKVTIGKSYEWWEVGTPPPSSTGV